MEIIDKILPYVLEWGLAILFAIGCIIVCAFWISLFVKYLLEEWRG
jgi:hypothetical protein